MVAAPATTWRGRTAIVKAGRAGNRGRLRARVAGVAAPRPPSEHCSIPGWLPPTRRAFHELHVWLHKKNPSGLFAPFNPNVSC